MIQWLTHREHVFPVVLGLTDGILTALTLGSGHLFPGASPLSLALSLRIAAASSVSGIFVFFAAEYSRARRELVHAEQQLNLARHGHLATTQLGRAVIRETILAGLLSSSCSFAGAFLPLAVGAVLPDPPWISATVALLALGVLGVAVSRSIYGRWLYWSLGLILAGATLTVIGALLHVA